MENLIEFAFDKKVIKDVDGEIIDMCFKGFRCTEDVMYKFCYFIGLLMDLPDVYVRVDDPEGYISRFKLPIGDTKQMIDEDILNPDPAFVDEYQEMIDDGVITYTDEYKEAIESPTEENLEEVRRKGIFKLVEDDEGLEKDIEGDICDN